MDNITGLIVFLAAVFAVMYIVRLLLDDDANLWQKCSDGNPQYSGIYPVLFLVDEDGDYDEVTALAEWRSAPVEHWVDHCTGEPCAPYAFYVLPARNWHD